MGEQGDSGLREKDIQGAGISEVFQTEKKSIDPTEKLRPFEITDADGATRQVFNFKVRTGGEVQAVFYQKEDLPFSKELLQDKQGFVLGGATNFRDVTEWHQFLNDTKEASFSKGDPQNIHSFDARKKIAEGKAVFFVENSPEHLLDLAFVLGLNDPKWREARKKAAIDREYTPEVTQMIDDLIAAAEVDENGQLIRRKDQKGEALVVLSLLGDKKASEVIRQKKAVIDAWDKEEQDEELGQLKLTAQMYQERGIQVNPRGYTATHTTKYRPKITPEGVQIRSTFDGSGGKLLRNTVHFSLVGPVIGALGGGSWENMDYIIQGNLEQIKDASGNPRRMSEVDTYFTVSPGEYVTVPNAHVTMPGKLPEGVVRQTEGDITFFKKGPYTPNEIDSFLSESYDKGQWEQDLAQRSLISTIQSSTHELRGEKIKQIKGSTDQEKANLAEYQRVQPWLEGLDISQLISQIRTDGIETAVKNLAYSETAVFNEDELSSLAKSVERWLTTKIRNGHFLESGGYGEGTSQSQEVVLQAALWGAFGDETRKAHGNDSEGLGTEYRGYKVFKDLKKAKQELEKYDQDVAANPNGFYSPRGFHERFVVGDGRDSRIVHFNDRVGIMDAVRERRGFLSRDKNIRRMLYVAGLI